LQQRPPADQMFDAGIHETATCNRLTNSIACSAASLQPRPR
jgi:hypothetical protein